jgi:16S rRNA (uracil1498-N3)-methyltransferase
MRTLLASAPLQVGDVELNGDEVRHGATVLRLRSGDEVRLADGAGHAGLATVVAIDGDRMRCRLDAIETLSPDPAQLLTVALAVPKGDRFTDVVRSLTELGVGRIVPLSCERGERMPNPERCRRVAAEAVKQCRRSHLPELTAMREIPTLAQSGSDLIVLDRNGSVSAPGQPKPTTLVIGPEGGFTDREQGVMRDLGAIPVRLAGPILRIETAALAAAAVWAHAWEGFKE